MTVARIKTAGPPSGPDAPNTLTSRRRLTMFKWSKVKATLLVVGVGVAFHLGGCGLLGNINLSRIPQLIAIGNIFD